MKLVKDIVGRVTGGQPSGATEATTVDPAQITEVDRAKQTKPKPQPPEDREELPIKIRGVFSRFGIDETEEQYQAMDAFNRLAKKATYFGSRHANQNIPQRTRQDARYNIGKFNRLFAKFGGIDVFIVEMVKAGAADQEIELLNAQAGPGGQKITYTRTDFLQKCKRLLQRIHYDKNSILHMRAIHEFEKLVKTIHGNDTTKGGENRIKIEKYLDNHWQGILYSAVDFKHFVDDEVLPGCNNPEQVTSFREHFGDLARGRTALNKTIADRNEFTDSKEVKSIEDRESIDSLRKDLNVNLTGLMMGMETFSGKLPQDKMAELAKIEHKFAHCINAYQGNLANFLKYETDYNLLSISVDLEPAEIEKKLIEIVNQYLEQSKK